MSETASENKDSTKKLPRLAWNQYWKLTKTSLKEFVQDDSFMHGAALAYYAVIALVPMIYLAITYFGIIVGQDRVVEIVGDLIESNMGITDSSSLTNLMYKFNVGKGANTILQITGIIALIFTSTAVFNSLSKSLNNFFGITPALEYGAFLNNLFKRLISFSLLAIFGAIIIVIYFTQSVLVAVGSRLLSNGSLGQDVLFSALEHVSIIAINFLAFSFVFKYLHDGFVKWKLAMTGAIFTAVLLYFGQIGINFYLANYFFAANSGIAGTIMVVLVWIFYTSQIIFLGAKYMSVYARMVGMPIVPRKIKL